MKFPPDKNQLANLFIVALCLEIAISVLVVVTSFVGLSLSDNPSPARLSDTEKAIFALSGLSILFFFPATIVAWVGLFKRWWWARWLYVGVNLVGFLIGLILGLFDWSRQWGLPNALSATGAAVSGVILSLLFLTPIAKLFERPINTEGDGAIEAPPHVHSADS